MTSCWALGHDVETIGTEDGGIYRHGSDRFVWTYLPAGDTDPVAHEQFLARGRAFGQWLALIHARDTAAVPLGCKPP